MSILKYTYGLLTGTLVSLEEYFTEDREYMFSRIVEYTAEAVRETFEMQDSSKGISPKKIQEIFVSVRKLLNDRLEHERKIPGRIDDAYDVVSLNTPVMVFRDGSFCSSFSSTEKKRRYGFGVNIEVVPILRVRRYEVNFIHDKVCSAIPTVTIGYKIFDKHTNEFIEITRVVRYGLDGKYHIDIPEKIRYEAIPA